MFLVDKRKLRSKRKDRASQIDSSKSQAAICRIVLPGFPTPKRIMTRDEISKYVSGDKIVCLLCGKSYRSLSNHLVRIHLIQNDEYRDMYGIPYTTALICQPLKELHRQTGIKNQAAGIASVKNMEGKRPTHWRNSIAARNAKRENINYCRKFNIMDTKAGRDMTSERLRTVSDEVAIEIFFSNESASYLSQKYGVRPHTVYNIKKKKYRYVNNIPLIKDSI